MKDKQAKYPQLRFKGFTAPWEQRKLGEIAIRVRGNDGRMNLPTLTISAGNGWMDQRDRFSQNIAGKEQKNYTLLRQGELSYNHGNSKLAQFGAVFELESYNEALVPRVYHSFSVTAGAQPKFIEQMFATHRPDRELRKLVSSGARMDGLLNINYDDFMGIKVWLPSVAEQQVIAGLLVKLDNTIALHQRKLAKLKELKQGYLQKLFPKNGSKFPQLRFAGFADAWEQRKLGEVFNQTVEYINPSEANLELWSVTVENGLTPKTERYNREALVKKNDKFKVVHDGDIVYNPMNLTIGAVGFNKTGKSVAVSGYYITMNMNAYFSNNYFKTWLKSANAIKQYKLYATGSLIEKQRVQFPTLSLIKSYIPNFEEQQKIGSFFKQLDDTIALHQRKLEKLQELKKGYLQKMFC
ncbi:hypothetical protein IMAU10031_01533 [Lactobacillus helveticus]|uniref:restriction endonuclease subunit S n=1 Tax=Lactobacillus helveticus TaxID=1587 RepID=UPI001562F2FF|nr:restriction endonuclease subunit S [Lactobacillus helveticus]NRO76668.1 hypothetical protein [Lactobacillus helveticus]